jgi:cyclic pyranopterin phosphate synthase
MVLHPEGNVQPCCWLPDYDLGKIQDQSLGAIWNSPQAQALRQEFLSGQIKTCTQQMQHLKCHLTSQRWYTDNIELSPVVPSPARRLDLRLNGKCNLECVMCNVWQQPNGTYNEENFWQVGQTELFPYLEELIVLGGEPFIQKDTFRLINEVSSRNKKCRWGFITNGQYELNEKILSSLDKIEIRYIQVSLDSVVAETYQAIRKKGHLSRALQTLQALIAYSQRRSLTQRGFLISVAMCVQKRNWREIHQFFKFARMMNLEVGLQFVSHPKSESLLTLSAPERLHILNELETLKRELVTDQLEVVIGPLRDSLRTASVVTERD